MNELHISEPIPMANVLLFLLNFSKSYSEILNGSNEQTIAANN